MRRINFYLPDWQIKELERAKETTEVSVSEQVRRAISNYLKASGFATEQEIMKEQGARYETEHSAE